MHRAARDVIIEHKRTGLDRRASVLRLIGEEAALRAAEDSKADQILVANAWWWVARYRALSGRPLGAAEAIRKITPGLILLDELISDNDLAPYMDIPEVRSAINLHGDLADWGTENTDAIN